MQREQRVSCHLLYLCACFFLSTYLSVSVIAIRTQYRIDLNDFALSFANVKLFNFATSLKTTVLFRCIRFIFMALQSARIRLNFQFYKISAISKRLQFPSTYVLCMVFFSLRNSVCTSWFLFFIFDGLKRTFLKGQQNKCGSTPEDRAE